MSRRVYGALMPWGHLFLFTADLAEASAPMCHVDEDGEETSSPYQTAGAVRLLELLTDLRDDIR